MAWAKFCNDYFVRFWMRVQWNFHWIQIPVENQNVKMDWNVKLATGQQLSEDINGLVQEGRNSIIRHWSYVFLALPHINDYHATYKSYFRNTTIKLTNFKLINFSNKGMKKIERTRYSIFGHDWCLILFWSGNNIWYPTCFLDIALYLGI